MTTPQLYMIDGRLTAESVHKVEGTDYVIYWLGFVYIDGSTGQHSSIEVLTKRLMELPITEAVSVLKGSFFCIIQYVSGDSYAFVDNSGMYAAYECNSGVSHSFLTLVDKLNLDAGDLAWTNIAEYVQTANLFFHKTFFGSIKKLAANEILHFSSETAVVQRLEKSIPLLSDQPADASLRAAFKGLATALSGGQVSVDVTGGLDTRTVIAGLIDHDVEFETAVSGPDNHEDVQIARQLAATIHKACFVTAHDTSRLQHELEGTLHSLDGLKGHLLTQHRISQLQQARSERGVQLCLRGVGGGQFRDNKWVQDFPFYRSSTTRFARFDRLRVEVIRIPPAMFTDSFKTHLHNARTTRIENYSRYKCHYNTQSYDLIDFYETHQNAHSRSMSVSAMAGVAVYCPLAELSMQQHAYHCPRSTRFGAFFQKHFITVCSKKLARVKTTYGATASTEPFYLVDGSVILVWTNVKRLIRKLSQTYLGKSPFIQVTATESGTTKFLRESAICEQSIEALIRHGVLLDSMKEEAISDRFIERLICLGWFLHRLDKKRDGQTDVNLG